jgi:hypothetical protein
MKKYGASHKVPGSMTQGKVSLKSFAACIIDMQHTFANIRVATCRRFALCLACNLNL